MPKNIVQWWQWGTTAVICIAFLVVLSLCSQYGIPIGIWMVTVRSWAPLWLIVVSVLLSTAFYTRLYQQYSPEIASKRYSQPLSVIAVVIIIPIVEEFLSRWATIVVFTAVFWLFWPLTTSLVVAIFVSAVIFGSYHLEHGWPKVILATLEGLILTVAMITGGLAVSMVIHVAQNLFAVVVGAITANNAGEDQ